jgi:ATP-dependent DNA helicase RecQ
MLLTEVEQNIIEARLEQLEAKKKMYSLLDTFSKEKMWKELKYKSLADYCRNALDFHFEEVKDLQRHLGMIIPTDRIVSDDPTIQDRIDKLKVWRRQKANMERIPPYRIITNRTLFEVAKAGPKSLDDLQKIPGIGNVKARTLGNELLKTINVY